MALTSRALRAARAISRVLGLDRRPAGLVLLYHRVATLDIDSQRLAVTLEHFTSHLEIIRRSWHPMTLPDLMTRARDGSLPERAIAVTFDDGYQDNLENALPLLEWFGVPATLFVASSFAGSGREFWWDELERMLLLPGEFPEHLRLRIGQSSREWHLGPVRRYPLEVFQKHQDWNVESAENPTVRHEIYRDLCGRLRLLTDEDRTAVLRELSAQAVDAADSRETHRPLTREEIVATAGRGLVDIGAHTETHPRLAALAPGAQRDEILGSRTRLREITGLGIDGFAYPFGGDDDYNADTMNLVRDAGFSWACAATPGLFGSGSDLFQVPRVLIRDWNAAEFAGRLDAAIGVGSSRGSA